MAIVFKNKIYSKDIVIDSRRIVGVMGNNYERLFKSIKGNIYTIKKERYYNEKTGFDELDLLNNQKEKGKETNDLIKIFLKELEIDNFLDKSINDLSDSELRLLDYLCMLISNPRVIIIDEPFLYFDYELKKKISYLLRRIIKSSTKTIIIGSNDSNLVYSFCQKVLLLKDKNFYYGDIDSLENDSLLKEYDIEIPNIVYFANLAHKKKVQIPYSRDIRDLIKDVYRNV